MQKNKLFTLVNCVFVVGAFLNAELMALPSADHVASGDVNFMQSAGAAGNALTVTQNSAKAIVNWNSFNVNVGDGVHFQQPDGGVCLNRIDPTNGMSQINGNLSATGAIFLINQAGIVFGKTAKVDVGGIIASTADIQDAEFLKNTFFGKQLDQASSYNGSIINRGVINITDNGFAALIGAGVANEGVIKAKASNIHLASGNKFTLDFWGSGLIDVEVAAPANAAGKDENGKNLANGLRNSGQIINEAGEVYLTARAAQGVFDNIINMDGVIQANTVHNYGNTIVLAGDGGTTYVSGKIDASGTAPESACAHIAVIGENVILDKNAVMDVSTVNGGSKIIVGWQNEFINGLEEFEIKIPESKHVYVGPQVSLIADSKATEPSSIIVAGTQTTFLGSASARGTGIDGGNIMIHGDENLKQGNQPRTDVSSVNGQHGEVIFADDVKIVAKVQQFIQSKLLEE